MSDTTRPLQAGPEPMVPLAQVRELLAAIRSTLDVPFAENYEDRRKADWLLVCRTAQLRGAITRVAGQEELGEFSFSAATSAVRSVVVDNPITYETYSSAQGRLAEQRHQLLDPAVPVLAVSQ